MKKNNLEKRGKIKAKGDSEEPKVKKERCLECGGKEFCYDDQKGETYCKTCGLIIEEEVDLGKDYAAGEDGGDKKRRTGPPGRYINGGSVGSTF